MLLRGPKNQKPGVHEAFHLKYYNHNGNTRKTTKNSIKPKNYPTSKTLRVLNKLDIDW